jgi:hypothetical protein
MGRIENWLFILAIQCVFVSNLLGKQDSTITHTYGIETGYQTYGSIDEIFTPFLYSGNAELFGFNTRRSASKSLVDFYIYFSQMDREPVTLNLKKSFTIPGIDEGVTNTWHAEPSFLKINTIKITVLSNYYFAIPLHFLQNDKIFIGVKNKLDAVLRPRFTSIEIVSFTINPGFYYLIKLNKKTNLSCETNLNILGISIRRPYAGAEAQVSNNYNFEFYKDYIAEHVQIDFLDQYFQILAKIKLEKNISSRLLVNLSYMTQYINLKVPRRLVSLDNSFNFGLSLKIK